MRRLWWLGTGYAAGLGTAAWMRGKVRRATRRYAPEQMRQAVADRTRDVGDRTRQAVVDGSRHLGREALRVAEDLREAAAEGRDAMRRTASELRDEDGRDSDGPDSDSPDIDSPGRDGRDEDRR